MNKRVLLGGFMVTVVMILCLTAGLFFCACNGEIQSPTTPAAGPAPTENVPDTMLNCEPTNLATEHIHIWLQTVTDPTCLENGYTTYSCNCGESYTDNEIAAKGHVWQPASCAAPKTCSVCTVTEGSAMEHNYETVTTPPTATEQGYRTNTCTVCGRSYKDNFTDPIGLGYAAGTLVFSVDGIARLYGENNQIVKTYTGWDTDYYHNSNATPWYADKDSVIHVIIQDGVTPKPMAHWFSEYQNLKSVFLGDTITLLGQRIFEGCTSLTKVRLGENISDISTYAFAGCYNLTDISIPASVTKIKEGAFNNCKNLLTITIPDSVTYIGNNAFSKCSSLTDVVIGKNVTSIGQGAFSGCINITRIIIPESVTAISSYMFYGCSGLSSVILEGEVTAIGEEAFRKCTGLRNIVLPNKLGHIGMSAFRDCANLTDIVYQGSVAEWKEIRLLLYWNKDAPAEYSQCLDGMVELPIY